MVAYYINRSTSEVHVYANVCHVVTDHHLSDRVTDPLGGLPLET